ncbi:hypothetical protein BLOT_010372 [Blomia tropicalis]|nr:hypothetical protein BLOT_010372 [Blomia tropicalis]
MQHNRLNHHHQHDHRFGSQSINDNNDNKTDTLNIKDDDEEIDDYYDDVRIDHMEQPSNEQMNEKVDVKVESIRLDSTTKESTTSSSGSLLAKFRGLLRKTRSRTNQQCRFTSAISVPNLTALPDTSATNDRSHSDPSMMSHSRSVSYGLNRLDELSESSKIDSNGSRSDYCHIPDNYSSIPSTSSSSSPSNNGSSCSTNKTNGSFTKNVKRMAPKPNRFESKTNSTIIGSNRSLQYQSCLCLSSDRAPNGTMPNQTFTNSNHSTLPLNLSMDNNNLRYRYLTYGTSAQLQQEYGKTLPWPTLTEFRLRRKFRRLKRSARKLIGVNLFSSKSSILRRFIGKRDQQQQTNNNKNLNQSSINVEIDRFKQNIDDVDDRHQISRSSSLTSLLDLIEEANKNLINSFNQSPHQTPKCPPRLKRTQSSINVSTSSSTSSGIGSSMKSSAISASSNNSCTPSISATNQLSKSFRSNRVGTLPLRNQPILVDDLLWKTNMNDYQIAFIDHSLIQSNNNNNQHQHHSKPIDVDTVSVKSLDSYFGPIQTTPTNVKRNNFNVKNNNNKLNGNKSIINGQTKSSFNQQLPKSSNSKSILCVRSHFEINNGTVYLEDSDWEMCSEISELNSLNMIDSNQTHSITSVPNDSKVSIQDECNESSSSFKPITKVEEPNIETEKQIVESKTQMESKPVLPDPTPTSLNVKKEEKEEEEEATISILDTIKLNKEPLVPIDEKDEDEIDECIKPVEAIYSVPIKKKLVKKPEPIYAKPNKPKYPPKHCCIHRPQQQPPPLPNIHSSTNTNIHRTRSNITQSNRNEPKKKTKAPAPPPPPPTSTLPTNNRNRTETNSSTTATTIVKPVSRPIWNKTTKTTSSSNTKLANNKTINSNKTVSTTNSTKLVSKRSNGYTPKVNIKPNEKKERKDNIVNINRRQHQQQSKPLTTKATNVTASKSPFKALINRLHSSKGGSSSTLTTELDVVQDHDQNDGKSEEIEHKQQTIQQPIQSSMDEEKKKEKNKLKEKEEATISIEEPIYTNTNINNESNESFASSISVNKLIEKFNSFTEQSSSGSASSSSISSMDLSSSLNEQAKNKTTTTTTIKLNDENDNRSSVRFESILSNRSTMNDLLSSSLSDNGNSTSKSLEGEFQHYLSELRHNSAEHLDQKHLIDKLCSELIQKFDSKPNLATMQTITPNTSWDSNSSNPNWLFLFFLHNQRQMFKEMLHEMFTTIQSNGNSIQSNGNHRSSEEINEFKQLIQLLQSTIVKNREESNNLSSQLIPVVDSSENAKTIDLTTNSDKPKNVLNTIIKKKKKSKFGRFTKMKKGKCEQSSKIAEEDEEEEGEEEEKEEDREEEKEKSEQKEQTKAEQANSETMGNVSASNRFVNKIVLNNRINQFNFTMNNQDHNHTSSSHSPPPKPSIVNVFNDYSTNTAANLFDMTNINENTNANSNENRKSSKDSTPNEQSASNGTVLVQTHNHDDQPNRAQSHRTVLEIKNPTNGTANSGLLGTLRYRLERKRNKKLMERYKKEQEQLNLSRSNLNLLDSIAESVETNQNNQQEQTVTLANTSKLEIKVENRQSTIGNCLMKEPLMHQQHQTTKKMGTLKRLILSTKGDANGRSKDKHVSTLNDLVEKHRNTGYVPSISDPYPTGFEYSLFGTVRKQNRLMIQDMEQNRQNKPRRSQSERNFRSISVIKLNEITSDEEEEEEVENVNYRRQSNVDSVIHYGHQSNHRFRHRPISSSSSNDYKRQSRQFDEKADEETIVDDDDDETSTSSNRSKMVTFTLPRNFKTKMVNNRLLENSIHSNQQQANMRRQLINRYQQFNDRYEQNDEDGEDVDDVESNIDDQLVNVPQRRLAEVDHDEIDELAEYFLTPCRLNERYFRNYANISHSTTSLSSNSMIRSNNNINRKRY